MKSALIPLCALLACAAQPGTAAATPFVDVASYITVSGLADSTGGTQPGDVLLLCDGVAARSCSVALRAQSGSSADYTYDASQTRNVTIQNTTGRTLSALYLSTDAAAAFAFPSRGVGVDDPATQAASFRAATSASLRDLGVFDAGGCTTSAARPVCSITSWDSTGPNPYLLDPLPGGGSMSFTITAALQAALWAPASVPEPASAAMVSAALIGLAAGLRRLARRGQRG